MAGVILRLRGLPFSATPEDVHGFFDGYETKDVYLGSKNGKRNGEAYVEFESAEDASRALKERQHEHLGSRYIEIFVAGEADLLAATSGEGEGAAPTLAGHVVRLRGLPFSATAADVLAFFEGVATLGGETGVVFTCTPDGRPSGEAYVALADAEAQAAALGRHKEKIGARYIEIFESSKGDMWQAVQQHGYFTTPGGRRRHHWHQQHGGGGGAAPPGGQAYPPDAGGGGGGGTPAGRGAQMGGVDDMTQAFAGFGLSQRDMQVPGPPRWGAYGAPADQQYQQYVLGGARGMQPMPPGTMRGTWRTPTGQLQQGMQRGGMQHFNPAPGPPPGKGGRGGVPNGTRQGMGGPLGPHEYAPAGGHGHAAAVMFNPFMMQPVMVAHQQQHPGSAWGAPAMMQQQGGGWYGGMGMGRAGMHSGMGAMGGHSAYAFSPQTGFYPVQQQQQQQQGSRAGLQQHMGGHAQQHSDRRQQPPSSGSASQAAAASQPAPAAADADGSGSAEQLPLPEAADANGAAEQPNSAASHGEAAAAASASAAPPPTPEQ